MEKFTMNQSAEVQRWARWQERRKAAMTAAAAVLYRIEPPRRTALERDAAREAERIYRHRQIEAMRARMRT